MGIINVHAHARVCIRVFLRYLYSSGSMLVKDTNLYIPESHIFSKKIICYLEPHVTYQWYTDMWNRHRESKIHDIHEIGSGTKLYYLWVKGFSTRGERDTQSFYADCFYIVSSQSNQRAAPIAHKFVWPGPPLNHDSLVRRQELSSLLFLKSQPMLPVRDVTHIS